jgi:hypothetical protein
LRVVPLHLLAGYHPAQDRGLHHPEIRRNQNFGVSPHQLVGRIAIQIDRSPVATVDDPGVIRPDDRVLKGLDD